MASPCGTAAPACYRDPVIAARCRSTSVRRSKARMSRATIRGGRAPPVAALSSGRASARACRCHRAENAHRRRRDRRSPLTRSRGPARSGGPRFEHHQRVSFGERRDHEAVGAASSGPRPLAPEPAEELHALSSRRARHQPARAAASDPTPATTRSSAGISHGRAGERFDEERRVLHPLEPPGEEHVGSRPAPAGAVRGHGGDVDTVRNRAAPSPAARRPKPIASCWSSSDTATITSAARIARSRKSSRERAATPLEARSSPPCR